jgi:hypothetical protein
MGRITSLLLIFRHPSTGARGGAAGGGEQRCEVPRLSAVAQARFLFHLLLLRCRGSRGETRTGRFRPPSSLSPSGCDRGRLPFRKRSLFVLARRGTRPGPSSRQVRPRSGQPLALRRTHTWRMWSPFRPKRCVASVPQRASSRCPQVGFCCHFYRYRFYQLGPDNRWGPQR